MYETFAVTKVRFYGFKVFKDPKIRITLVFLTYGSKVKGEQKIALLSLRRIIYLLSPIKVFMSSILHATSGTS